MSQKIEELMSLLDISMRCGRRSFSSHQSALKRANPFGDEKAGECIIQEILRCS